MLSSDDVDQELPIEVDDEFITKDGVLPMPPGKPSLRICSSNAHTRLMFVLSKVIKYIYPTKGLEESGQGSLKSSYVISHAVCYILFMFFQVKLAAVLTKNVFLRASCLGAQHPAPNIS